MSYRNDCHDGKVAWATYGRELEDAVDVCKTLESKTGHAWYRWFTQHADRCQLLNRWKQIGRVDQVGPMKAMDGRGDQEENRKTVRPAKPVEVKLDQAGRPEQKSRDSELG